MGSKSSFNGAVLLMPDLAESRWPLSSNELKSVTGKSREIRWFEQMSSKTS